MNGSPYVFISYAHLDSNIVLPCIEAMKKSGIELWYDNGIQAGSEWPEYIAEKVVSCTKFVLFVSNAYLQSQNCKRELNFAISQKKNILSIFIEEVHLSPGMEMQLGTYQAIYRNRFTSVDAFHNSLCTEQYFDECRKSGVSYATPSGSTASNSSYSSPQTQSFGTTPSSQTASTSSAASQTYAFGTNASGASTAGASFANFFTNTSQATYAAPSSIPIKNRFLAAFLAIFFGTFGIHKFYLNQIKFGVFYLIFFWTYIPFFLGLIEGFRLLFASKEKLEQKYKCKF